VLTALIVVGLLAGAGMLAIRRWPGGRRRDHRSHQLTLALNGLFLVSVVASYVLSAVFGLFWLGLVAIAAGGVAVIAVELLYGRRGDPDRTKTP
jgi:peptidoglycan/LPS O-acetylase OafA/YrhL